MVSWNYSDPLSLPQYKLTKVITIAPRFLVKNAFSYSLKIRQHSTDKVFDIAPDTRLPLHELQSRAPPQLCMAFDEPNLKWCAVSAVACQPELTELQVCAFQYR